VLTGPFSPLFGPFFRAKRAGPARLGPLRAGLGQKIKPAGTADPARFLAGLHRARAGPGRAARLAISSSDFRRLEPVRAAPIHSCVVTGEREPFCARASRCCQKPPVFIYSPSELSSRLAAANARIGSGTAILHPILCFANPGTEQW
jgi:hypothetical protein